MAPNFLLSPMGSTNFMRLSLKKGARAAISRAACRKFGVFAPTPRLSGDVAKTRSSDLLSSRSQREISDSPPYAAFFRLLTLRRSAALGDFAFACCARTPPSEICFLRAFSRKKPPCRHCVLAGFLRQLPSSCSLFPGTGSYPGQQREDFAYDLLFEGILFSSRSEIQMHTSPTAVNHSGLCLMCSTDGERRFSRRHKEALFTQTATAPGPERGPTCSTMSPVR